MELKCMNWVARIEFKNVRYLCKAAQAALAINQSPKDLQNQFMDICWAEYQKSKDLTALELGLEHLTAYFQSGYSVRKVSHVCDDIAVAAGYNSLEDYLYSIHYKYFNHSRSFTRHVIDSILGPGHASESYYGLKRSDIVDEITYKCITREVGTYPYVVYCKGFVKICYLIVKKDVILMQDNDGVEYKLTNIPAIPAEIKQIGNQSRNISFNSPDFIPIAVLSSINKQDNDSEKVHKKFMHIYWNFYKHLKNKIYLDFALEHIAEYCKARLEVNHLDDSVIDEIITAAGFQSIKDFLYTHLNKVKVHRIHLSRATIEAILGAGFASKSQGGITREEIIKDICAKVKNNETGTHDYMIYDDKNQEHLKQLVIEKDKSYMKDDLNNIFIFFVN